MLLFVSNFHCLVMIVLAKQKLKLPIVERKEAAEKKGLFVKGLLMKKILLLLCCYLALNVQVASNFAS